MCGSGREAAGGVVCGAGGACAACSVGWGGWAGSGLGVTGVGGSVAARVVRVAWLACATPCGGRSVRVCGSGRGAAGGVVCEASEVCAACGVS